MKRKYFTILNNYQYGAYPFTMLHRFIYGEYRLNRHMRVVFLEVPEESKTCISIVNRCIAGNFKDKQIVKPLVISEEQVIRFAQENVNLQKNWKN